MKVLIIIIILFLLNSCYNNNKVNNIKLVESDIYTTTINDQRVANIQKEVFIKGKEGLRDALVKQAYRYIFSPAAIEMGHDKKDEVKEAILKRQNKILSKKVIQNIKEIKISDEEIRKYFIENIDLYTGNFKYDISFLSIGCEIESHCINKLNEMLSNNSFKELSIIYKDKNIRNGYFEKIELTSFNKKFQNMIQNMPINKISTPMKFGKDNYLFIKVLNVTSPITPKLHIYKNSIKSHLSKLSKTNEITKLKNSIISNKPLLKNFNTNYVLSDYARTIKLDKSPYTKMLLERAKRWVLADYGYFDSFVFNEIDANKIRDISIFDQNILKKLTRFSLTIKTHDIKNQNNKETQDIKELSFITYKEFLSLYPFLKINLYTIPYKKLINPIEYNGKNYIVYKSYQGVSPDDSQLLMDYKKHMRFLMGEYSSFMKQIGNPINLKINPIIYSEDWPKNAKIYYEILQSNK